MSEKQQHTLETAPENRPTAVDRIVSTTRKGIVEASHGTVQLTGDVMNFGVDAAAHLTGKGFRSLYTGFIELYRGAVGESFHKDRKKKD